MCVGMLGANHSHDLNEVFVWMNGAARVELVHATLMDYNVCAIREEHASKVDFRSAEVHLPQDSALFNIPAEKVTEFVCEKNCLRTSTSQDARRENFESF